MPDALSQTDFEVLVRRAGLRLTPDQVTELYGSWPHYQGMLERIRGHERGRDAEPALIFVPEPRP